MAEYLSKIDSVELMIFSLAIGFGLLLGLAVIADYWHKIRKAELAAKLKQDMLDRGMSAEEIRIVLDAGTKKSTFGDGC